MYLNVNSAFNCDGRSQGHPNGGAKSERANDAFGKPGNVETRHKNVEHSDCNR